MPEKALRVLYDEITAKRVMRFVTMIALAVWFGGFTFYSTAVISTSQNVLHSQLRAGLITQQVTNWLNWISLPTLAICGWNLLAHRRSRPRGWLLVMTAALAGMALAQFALFPAHWILDGQIIGREVLDDGKFFRLHRLYLAIATLQWCATLVYIWAAVVIWEDKPTLTRAESRAEQGVAA